MSTQEDTCGSCKRRLILDPSAEMIPHFECQVCRSDSSELAPKLKFCLACFINPEKHSWEHPYIVVRDWDIMPSPLATGWTQREDMALINGVGKFGYDNWEEICEHALKFAHSQEECRQRFEFLRRAVGERPTTEEDRSASDAKLREKAKRVSQVPGATLIGYSPLREELDNVYANDAELLIADMIFGPEDEDSVENGAAWKDLKLRVLRNYNLKLDVREQRRRFVLERGLLDFRRIQETRKRLAQSSQQQAQSGATAASILQLELDSLGRFMTAQEMSQFHRGIVKERALRDEVRKLQQYRAIGLRTYDEVDAYSKLAAKRNHQLLQQQQQEPNGAHETEVADNTGPKRAHIDDEADEGSGSSTLSQDPAALYLTPEELECCQKLSVTPSHYFVIKEAIFKEALRNGGCISRPQAMVLVSVELTKVDSLLDFFVKCDWVRREEHHGS